MTRTRLLAFPLLLVGILATALPARAAVTVELSASATSVTFGESVTLSGTLVPAAAETVEIVDVGTGSVIDTVTSDAGTGAYSYSFEPGASMSVIARAVAESPPVEIGVRPAVSVSLGATRLFDRAQVNGTVQPASAEGTAVVRLVRDGATLSQTSVPVTGGGFSAMLPVVKPGSQVAVATVTATGYLDGEGQSGARTPPLPRLRQGSRGVFVLLLERRLRALDYKSPKPNRRFRGRTGDAVLAFSKVQGQRRSRRVGPRTWRALASPKMPKPRSTSPSFHIEVDQTKQVLYVVRDGKIAKIVHVSTGGRGVGTTRDGSWRIWLKFAGFSPKGLYMPAFFDGGRALHGWPDVPPVPASHGCVRIPMWIAPWLYRQVRVGNVVRIYHS